ncbi:MAG: glycosyltransferase family 9 protein [Bacteriovoracaceae bacterium]|nr:glycosyltransferase family 9 protein [Bacteriovoracaceae bacterium]
MKIKKKILIIRFSSFGDIVQSMSALEVLKRKFPESEIHWVVRSDLASIVNLHPLIDRIWSFDRMDGIKGVIKLAFILKGIGFDYVYDAHASIRSGIIMNVLCPFWKRIFSDCDNVIIRHKNRLKRLLLFYLHRNFFPRPFRGMHSYMSPLEKWGGRPVPNKSFSEWRFAGETMRKIEEQIPECFGRENIITLVPSAAWDMKKWPLPYWKRLVSLLPEFNFLVLGGPNDLDLGEIEAVDEGRVKNLAGKLTLSESCAVISRSSFLISGDTGLLHVADFLKISGLALIGPTAFGYTSGETISTIEIELPCKPCTKDGSGSCSQSVYQKCMVDISPEHVAEKVMRDFSSSSKADC